MKKFSLYALLMAMVLIPVLALAQAAADVPVGDFLTQVLLQIKGFGGLSWMGKVSVIVMLIVGSMKVSVLNQMVWSKLGKAQPWVAPMLGLVGGILSLGVSGQITLAGVMAYVGAGAGAIIVHELLDLVKALPGISPLWAAIIGMIEGALGGGVKPPAPPAA